MGWLHRLFISPLKDLWSHLHYSRQRRCRRRGMYVLYRDVKSCSCEDVQKLWSMLVEDRSHAGSRRPCSCCSPLSHRISHTLACIDQH